MFSQDNFDLVVKLFYLRQFQLGCKTILIFRQIFGLETSFDENLGIFGPGGQDGANGCDRALGARPPHPRTGPDTTPSPYPKGQNPAKPDIRLGSRGGVGLMCLGPGGAQPAAGSRLAATP